MSRAKRPAKWDDAREHIRKARELAEKYNTEMPPPELLDLPPEWDDLLNRIK